MENTLRLKRLCLLVLLFLVWMVARESRGAVTNVQALVTFTNTVKGVTNGDTITVNGSIRRYTNGTLAAASGWIQSTNVPGWAATNTWLHLATYSPGGVDRVYTTNTNALVIVGTFRTNTALVVSLSSGVGTVSYSTNVWAEAYSLMAPNGSLPTEAARTNNASGLIGLLNDNRQTNAVENGIGALSNLLDRISQQTASNKVFRVVTNDGALLTNAWGVAGSNLQFRTYALTGDGRILGLTNLAGTNWAGTNFVLYLGSISGLSSVSGYLGTLTNGTIWSNVLRYANITNGNASALVLLNPVTTNLINYGNAIRSEGSGGNSLQVGSNATASGSLSMAIGNNSTASGESSLAVGNGSTATNVGATAIGVSSAASASAATSIGTSASASGNYAIAIGYGSVASGVGAFAGIGTASASSAIAIGSDSEATADSAVGIGYVASAAGVESTALGPSSYAANYRSLAIGVGSSATHSNSAAIGPTDTLGNAAGTTTTNQVRVGTAQTVLSVPGFIQGTISNLVTASGQTNVLDGDLSTPIGTITSIANGANRLNMGTQSVINISGSPSAAWSISGVIFGATTPRDGHRLHLRNGTGYDAVLAHNSGLEAIAAYRLSSPSGVDIILTNGALAQLVYSASDSRWLIWSVYDGRIPVINATATNAITSVFTNGVSISGAALTNLNIIYGSNMVFRATNTSGSVDLHISSSASGTGLQTNANQFAGSTLSIKTGAVVTNLANYGNAFVSYGSGSSSLQLGPSAGAAGVSSIAIGESSVANGNDSLAILRESTADALDTIAIGAEATASKIGAMAIGAYSTSAFSNSLALGPRDHLGNVVSTTATNQIRIGTSNATVSIPGALEVAGSAITPFSGNTNQLSGSNSASIKDTPFITNLVAYANGTNSIKVSDGTATAPSIGFINEPSSGLVRKAANNFGFHIDGTRVSVILPTIFAFPDYLAFGWYSPSFGGFDTQIYRDSAATIQLGQDVASTVNYTLKSGDGYGTDKTGASLSFAGGQGTGTGAGGTLNFMTAPAGGASGSSANAYATRMSIDSTGLITAYSLAASNLSYLPKTLTASTNVTVDLSAGSMQALTITADTTLAVTNVASGRNVSLFINITNASEYKLIMPSGIRLYSGAVTNTITTNKSAVVSFTSFDGISTNLVTTIAIEP